MDRFGNDDIVGVCLMCCFYSSNFFFHKFCHQKRLLHMTPRHPREFYRVEAQGVSQRGRVHCEHVGFGGGRLSWSSPVALSRCQGFSFRDGTKKSGRGRRETFGLPEVVAHSTVEGYF